MIYNNFLGKKTSLLGFGTMRLPMMENDNEKVDEKESIRIIREAIDNGVNYIDTAYMYHDGLSEVIVGKALKDGYREKVFLADKLAVWFKNDETSLEDIFNEQLKRLDDDYIDYYLVHNIFEANWEKILEYETLPFLERLKKEDKIGHIGFSFHGETTKFFKEVLDYYPWEFCQIQLNYMDKNFQAGLEGLEYAREKNIPVIVMEPLKGGKLTDKIPEKIKVLFEKSPTKKTPAKWAFDWLMSQKGINLILSGMSNEKQLLDNLNIFENEYDLPLKKDELDFIDKVSDTYNSLIKYGCTECKYCMPCAVKIDIPQVMFYLNEYSLFDKNVKVKNDFKMFSNPKAQPKDCTKCGQCMEKCPQSLNIISAMEEAKQIFN